jgi:hypothetical protein
LIFRKLEKRMDFIFGIWVRKKKRKGVLMDRLRFSDFNDEGFCGDIVRKETVLVVSIPA